MDDRIDYDRRWKKFNIPVRYRGLRLVHSQMTQANRQALYTAKSLADSFAERYAPTSTESRPNLVGRGVVISGNPGTGKSRISCGMATDIHLATNYSVLFLPVTNFFALGREQQKFINIAEKFRDEEALARVKQLQELMDRVLKVPFLVFDDLGKEYSAASGWVGTEIHRILRTRFDRGLPTAITTNLPLEEWQKYDGAMYSFLQEAYDLVTIGGQDWRRA
ncbi:ATP-binding protein [Streptomyces atratus]|uniref:ATP-binding protein n=1 Tax=Streptomyces atratus TaxID=1893 RepID=UPI0036514B72